MAKLPRQQVRRVVTGVNQAGKSYAVVDGNCECQAIQEQYVSVDLWSFGLPAATEGPVDIPAVPDIDGVPGEVIWRRFTLGPRERIAFHATDTVDLMTVLSGSITMTLEEGQDIKLGPGDCVVQRGTRHGWLNESDEPCTLIGVMASTIPE